MTPHGRGPRADLLADLTDAQRKAVTHFEGPLLILAGAGSGKTRVITRRVAWLLDQGVRPSSILAITFTNKAAGEMRQRVEALVPNSRVWVSTFHSLGARLRRPAPLAGSGPALRRGPAVGAGRPLPVRADRRIPGHQHGPVRDRAEIIS